MAADAATTDPEVSFDVERLDIDVIHRFLSTEAAWSIGIPRGVVERAVDRSLCVGAYRGARQVGFARLVTDRATFAYLADVFVVATERGRGLATRMVARLLAHDDVQGLRRVLLFTSDAHPVYERLGFGALAHPSRAMEIVTPDVYRSDSSAV